MFICYVKTYIIIYFFIVWITKVTFQIVYVVSFYVVVYGFEIFIDSFERGRTTGSLLDLPSWIAELPVPFCFLMLIIQAILEIKKMANGITPPSGDH